MILAVSISRVVMLLPKGSMHADVVRLMLRVHLFCFLYAHGETMLCRLGVSVRLDGRDG